MDLKDLENEVAIWAAGKGIFQKSDADAQMSKMSEEVEELDTEVRLLGGREAVKNELGDVLVTCVVQSRFHDLTLAECLEAALNKITKRTGRMINGQFVKDCP